jgi:hypothetical protein
MDAVRPLFCMESEDESGSDDDSVFIDLSRDYFFEGFDLSRD